MHMTKEELINEWNKIIIKDDVIEKMRLLYNSELKFKKLEEPPIFWIWNKAKE